MRLVQGTSMSTATANAKKRARGSPDVALVRYARRRRRLFAPPYFLLPIRTRVRCSTSVQPPSFLLPIRTRVRCSTSVQRMYLIEAYQCSNMCSPFKFGGLCQVCHDAACIAAVRI